MQRADVAAFERVLELHAHREVDRLGRDPNELTALVLAVERRVGCGDMPKPTGSVRNVNGVWMARVRLKGEDKPSFAMQWCTTEDAAKERALLLSSTAQQLRRAKADSAVSRKVLEALAAASSERALRVALLAAEKVVGQQVQPVGAPTTPTFRELGERWTSGKLAEEFPDHVKVKRSVEDDVQRLRDHVYPVLGSVPIDRVTLEMCQEVMRRLPSELATATRRHVAGLMSRLFNIAVYPMQLIAASPLPRGFLPRPGPRKAFAVLYVDEDARLLACQAVPLAYRVLWGFLAREGLREGEALALDWTDFDLRRGLVRLDINKTDDPRSWALQPGTASALRVWHELRPGTQRVFTDEHDLPFTETGALGLPATLREHLRLIGLADERPELFESTKQRQQMRVHDLRGTFVTIALANGRSEAWVSDRTGHRSSAMINRYKRVARSFQELNQGDLLPLVKAIPELREKTTGHELDTASSKYAESLASPAGFEPASPT